MASQQKGPLQHHSRANSAVSALLGQAGQALGAVAAPSSASTAGQTGLAFVPRSTSTSTSTSAATSNHQLSNPTISPSFGIGHPQQHHHRPASSSLSALPATDDSSVDLDLHLHLQPPLQSSAAGNTGTGIGIGLNQRAVSAAASTSTNHHPPPTYHNSAGFLTSNAHAPQFPYRPASYATLGQTSLPPSSTTQDSPGLPPSDVLIPGLRPSLGSAQGGSSSGLGLGSLLSPQPMFDLPSIPTSNDDFASIPYLNSNSSTSSSSTPKDTMSQQQQYAAPRRTGGYDEQHHMSGSNQYQHGQLSPREYSTPSAGPHIKLDQAPSNPPSYQNTPSVPSVLQPGPPMGRPTAIGATTAPTLPTMQASMSQQQDYQTPSKPTLNLSHSYSRSSPSAGGYDASNPAFSPYTPTTPGGAGASSSQFMSPNDRGYNAPGSQRNISHTPLGLADIRPRADSSLSDGMPSGLDFGAQGPPAGTSNYMAPWATYAFDWCKWAPQGNGAGKVAMGSYLEDGHNFIQILDTQIVPTPSDVYNNHGGPKWTMDFTKIAEATHSYPVTRLLWEPPSSTKQSTDLLATSGDHLRLWSLPSDTPSNPGNSITGRNREAATTKLTPLALLSNSKTPDHTAPLTSLDWNTVSPSLIITSSIDTTCTIWDIPSLTAKTQLIAHDKEVYDVRFCANSVDVFVSCGQDGSVRMFDLRSLEHSTIIYEPTGKEDRLDVNGGKMSPTLAQQTMTNPPPLLRIATSPHDTQLLATFAQDSNIIRILDTRQPGQALLELRGHGGAVNCIDWSPTRRGQLASGADDCQVLIWDLMNQPQTNGSSQSDSVRSPAASWQCDYEVGNLGWVPRVPNDEAGEWLGVSAGRGIWGVRM